jgi:hypothetical protein
VENKKQGGYIPSRGGTVSRYANTYTATLYFPLNVLAQHYTFEALLHIVSISYSSGIPFVNAFICLLVGRSYLVNGEEAHAQPRKPTLHIIDTEVPRKYVQFSIIVP